MHHDACGVGFIARIAGAPDHQIVRHGLTALAALAHRGAPASLGSVDGCGLLTAIPWTLIGASLDGSMPRGRSRAVGLLFVHPADRDRAAALVECELGRAGAACVWRTVPVEPRAVLRSQRATTPRVLQFVAGFPDGREALHRTLFDLRVRIEAGARAAALRLGVVSLSASTIVYKALTTPDRLPDFYPDLVDPRFESPFVVFHQRFSTNTSADWALAQPFRFIAHNGEINTIAGNRAWMQARLRDGSSLPGFADGEPIAVDGSDSRSLDDAVALLRSRGYPLAHAVARLVPPAWERDRDLAPDVRAFHQFQSLISEPWDGPSALAFADGRFVGAALDRNGFRPARIVRTTAGLIAVASEVGVLSAAEHEIADRGRLGPGDMLLVDLARGAVMNTNDIHRRLAFRRRYRSMVEDAISPLPPLPPVQPVPPLQPFPPLPPSKDLVVRQFAHGCTREEIDVLIRPMAGEGHEAVGSMGDDTPPAVMSSRPRLFTDYFRQRFAQVTNPPLDPYRESAVMSLTTWIGAQGSYLDEAAPRPPRVQLRSPILTVEELDRLRDTAQLAPVTIATLFEVDGGAIGLERGLDAVAAEAVAAVEAGAALVILSDRDIAADRAALPALLATAAVHQGLIRYGLRMRTSIVVDCGDARDAHQIAALCAFGAAAVCPSLGYQTVAAIAEHDPTGCDRPMVRYRLALERGLRTILSKMGVSTASGYCGAGLFEILGLDAAMAARYFPGAPVHPGAADLAAIAAPVVARHRRAFAAPAATLDYPGLHRYRRDGEYHAANPLVVRGLQKARDEGRHAYETFTSHVQRRPPAAVRDLLTFATERVDSAGEPASTGAVESVEAICRRFFASAMSVGALSPEAHRTIARAMNQIGARSNSGEGGEEPDRFWHEDGNRTRQVASARFGVTPAYLRSADELQIKIAQGSKPGEGGQLPAAKVVPHIARLRHAQPGQTLISPPVHHDIYSIEDLAQLIYDLKALNPSARINVKLVSSSGVGIVAVGVAKAGADAIQISGHDGGTGASPRGSIKHAGLPWEIGVSEAHRALSAAGLRSRVVLQTDGGLKTGRDIAVAAALGADEYGFGTAALVAIGCVMARQCHANSCPVGIATQREELRDAFTGTPEMLIGYLQLVAGEVREILASFGLQSIAQLVGRTDLLRKRCDVPITVDVDRLLAAPAWRLPAGTTAAPAAGARRTRSDEWCSLDLPFIRNGRIANTDRAFGTNLAGAIALEYGDAGVPDGSVAMTMTGSAGQSFAAFALPGMRFTLIGDANDGLGKGMHGGEIVVTAAARERGRGDQVLVGNAALYGATGGRVFIAGRAGERFAVRNSGATAVVEGVGDHGCEYMTGGVVLVLGTVGRNFAAGMTGGVIYVCDRQRLPLARAASAHVTIESLSASDHLVVGELLQTHERLTGSRLARAMLRHDRALTAFKRVVSTAAVAAVVCTPEATADRGACERSA